MFPEALMLHYLDDLDSKMEAMRAQFQREADFEGPWTSYNPSLGRPLLNSAKLMRTVPELAAVPPPPPEPATAEISSESRPLDLFGEHKDDAAAAAGAGVPITKN